jgi:serine protease DegQ
MYFHKNQSGVFLPLYIFFFITMLIPAFVFPLDDSFLMKMEKDIIRLVDEVKPSVVTISATFEYILTKEEKSTLSLWGGENIKEKGAPIEVTNIGSGIIYDSTHVVTKLSIIQGSTSIQIGFHDGQTVEGRFIGFDPEYGLAVIEVKKAGLHPVKFSSSQKLSIGSWALIVGNSLGVSPAVSLGMVNCIRTDGIIQVTASIPAGNAGGPLFDSAGHLLGLIAAKINAEGDEYAGSARIFNESILVYPADELDKRILQILTQTEEANGWIGVTAENWPGRLGGVHITNVTPESPADKAGLQMGDIIMSMDGVETNHANQLARDIIHHHPGDMVHFAVLRGTGVQSISVTVGDAFKPVSTQLSSSNNLPPPLIPTFSEESPLELDGNNPQYDQLRRDFLMGKLRNMEQEIETLRSMINKY